MGSKGKKKIYQFRTTLVSTGDVRCTAIVPNAGNLCAPIKNISTVLREEKGTFSVMGFTLKMFNVIYSRIRI